MRDVFDSSLVFRYRSDEDDAAFWNRLIPTTLRQADDEVRSSARGINILALDAL